MQPQFTDISVIGISGSAVTNMSGAFEGRADFNESIGGWNTSSVIDMSYMFACRLPAFNQYIGEWNNFSIQCGHLRQ